MAFVKSVLILLAGAALATFLWSNYDQTVVVYFTKYVRTIEIPLAAALVVSLLVGLLLAFMLSLPNQIRLRGRIRDLTRKNDRLENEIAELRKLPFDDALPASGASNTREATRGRTEPGPAVKPAG